MFESLKADLTHWLRRQGAWVDFRSAQREGWGLVLSRRRLWPKILRTRPIPTDPVQPGVPVEVHHMCWHRDWLSAIWALKSFYHYAQVRYPLVIHFQSAMPPSAVVHLRNHFPNARIVTSEEANATVPNQLAEAGLSRCIAMRTVDPFTHKLFDFHLMSQGTNLLNFDTDVLFFKRPAELLQADGAPFDRFLFQQDAHNAYNGMTIEQAKAELGIELVPRVCVGVLLRAKQSLSLKRVNELLEHPVVSKPTGHTEQLLYALCASEARKAELLPPTYGLTLGGGMDCSTLVCRHYAGPSRPWLTWEGIPHLIQQGFLEELAK